MPPSHLLLFSCSISSILAAVKESKTDPCEMMWRGYRGDLGLFYDLTSASERATRYCGMALISFSFIKDGPVYPPRKEIRKEATFLHIWRRPWILPHHLTRLGTAQWLWASSGFSCHNELVVDYNANIDIAAKKPEILKHGCFTQNRTSEQRLVSYHIAAYIWTHTVTHNLIRLLFRWLSLTRLIFVLFILTSHESDKVRHLCVFKLPKLLM